jgi:RNA polymerase sigma-70 factor (family 1)
MGSYHSLTDIELTGLLQQGDVMAFTEIYNRYWKKLFAVAGNKIRDLDEAEEIVQDIFVSLWARREQLRITGTLSAYLAVSVKYRVIKALDKQYHRQQYADHSRQALSLLDNSTQDWLQFEELKDRLSQLVADLPEKCRLVYQLSRESGYSQKQIAEELNISEKTVEAHIGKALKNIRSGLQQFLIFLL